MDIRNRSSRGTSEARGQRRRRQRGAASIQILVILVPVIFGMMGFAVDLGKLYLVRWEIKAAANAMALAAARQLIGTDAALGAANTAARTAIQNTGGAGNKFDFGSIVVGETDGFLTSSADDPAYFDTVASAAATDGGGSQASGGSTARFARVNISAEAPLLFWGFLSLGQERKVTVVAQAVAGISAPLCTACGIEPIAIAAVDSTDAVDFGFLAATRYTFIFQCTGPPLPPALANAGSRMNYLVINRLDTDSTTFTDENTQLFRNGAQGLPGNAVAAKACISVNTQEQIWASATPLACATNSVPPPVQSFLCGVAMRFDSAVPGTCVNIPESDTLASAYTPDTDITELDDYAAYTGNGRRIITIPIVDALATDGTMTVLGFRQFLVEPTAGDINISPTDQYGRFAALYIGSAAPLRQGAFGSCGITAGPGKVVLHQ